MLKILIVEDEEFLLDELAEKIGAMGYEVIEAVNGKMGLEKSIKNKPDLIILDLLMPQMDGITMITKLRESGDYGKKVSVLILTNLEPDNKIVSNMLKTQPVYYLVKSNTSLEEVCEKVKEISAGTTFFS